MLYGSLSKYIVIHIYSEWLNVTELCKLDSAFCDHVDRENFLNLIGNEHVGYNGLSDIFVNRRFQAWLFARKLYIRHLSLKPYLLNGISDLTIYSKLLSFHMAHLHAKKGLLTLLPNCSNLTSLTIDDITRLNDTVVTSIGDNCNKINTLNLGGKWSVTNKEFNVCNKVTDKSFIYLTGCCKSIANISLDGLCRVTDAAIEALCVNCN